MSALIEGQLSCSLGCSCNKRGLFSLAELGSMRVCPDRGAAINA